ncbi:MAG: hypothetical protein K9L79_01550 [Methylobacter tundripaludum]|nr:hypothetical protein [Methylobacter tundripaludum]
MSQHRITLPPSSAIKVVGGGNTLIIAPFTASPGEPGASAYKVAVLNGFIGTETEWLASLAAPATDFDLDLVTIYNLYK